MRSTQRLQHGFTLLELIVVVVIIGIIVTISIGRYGTVIAESRVNDVSNRLRGFIALARNESISRGGHVRLCGSTDGFTCAPTLSSGWLIYYDADTDDILDATDEIISWQEQGHAATTVAVADSAGNSLNNIEFNYRGYTQRELSVTIANNTFNRVVIVHRTGRLEQL